MKDPEQSIEVHLPVEQAVHEEMTMDLGKAREILSLIVASPEDQITENTPFERLGNFSAGEIRLALQVVALDLINTSDNVGLFGATQWITKKGLPNSEGIYSELMFKVNARNNRERRPYKMSLDLSEYKPSGLGPLTRLVLSNEHYLEDPVYPYERVAVGFHDLRTNPPRIETLSSFDRDPSLDGYRHMWKGLRWMSANLLDWKMNSGILMPEDLPKTCLIGRR